MGKYHFLGSIAGLNKIGTSEFSKRGLELLTMFANQVSTAIENVMVDLAHNLGLAVVAEGVEEEDVMGMIQSRTRAFYAHAFPGTRETQTFPAGGRSYLAIVGPAPFMPMLSRVRGEPQTD